MDFYGVVYTFFDEGGVEVGEGGLALRNTHATTTRLLKPSQRAHIDSMPGSRGLLYK